MEKLCYCCYHKLNLKQPYCTVHIICETHTTHILSDEQINVLLFYHTTDTPAAYVMQRNASDRTERTEQKDGKKEIRPAFIYQTSLSIYLSSIYSTTTTKLRAYGWRVELCC